ncbi:MULTISPECIES: DivIVA domain-containing protein [unclassified Arthrobacter]|uniref:DivIVA domain-containing protein n=1 Tax=unclassified Arthrobacter TaxID=235627 RepID=UPI00031C9AE7|nr:MULTISPECIES: DivIVA domain-containing protein [unclassified Arthrobacter]
MSIFLVFIAIAVVGAVAFAVVGRQRPGGDLTVPGHPAGLVEPAPSLPAVLLPDDPHPSDIDRIRFAPALRGYRMDQVDEVLEKLASALAERDEIIADLRRSRQDSR